MKNLAEKEYWDSVYKGMGRKGRTSRGFKNWLKEISRDYSNFIIWETLLPKYLPRNDELKILEVGCAPGKYLIKFNKQYGYLPYGVEYSEDGAIIARQNFRKVGLPEENIIQTDFFDPNFQSGNSDRYDVVFSRGFIEHYDSVGKVVADHRKLLKPGGFLVLMIPNLSGLNRYLAKFLNINSFNLHNISIMNKKSFSDLFPAEEFEHLYCDYVGIFSFGLFNTNKKWKYYLHRLFLVIQRPFDLLLRLLFPNGLKHKYTSPYLLFIGRKK